MSVASRRLWWAALVICAATLAGIVIGELTIDLPRVRSRRNMVIGPAGAAVWMVAGLISWRVRPDSKVGPLMVLIGWLHPADPLLGGLGGAHVQWVIFILIPLSTLILQMALSFPNGRLTRAARITVGVAWAGWFIAAIAVALDPRSERCPACPPNPIPFADQDVSDVIYEVREPLELAAWTVTAVILAQRWRTASKPGRRALNPMLWGTMQYAILTVLLVPLGFGLSDGRPDKPAFWSFALIPVGVLIGMLRTRQHHSVVADLMVELRAQPGPEGLRALLARTLGDPSLRARVLAARPPHLRRRRRARRSRSPRTTAVASRCCATTATSRSRRWSTTPRCSRIRSCSGRCPRPRSSRSRTRACRPSCARGCTTCANRASGS